MDLLETEEFDKAGFKNLHVAGHPEGNMDIDKEGSTKNVDCCNFLEARIFTREQTLIWQ